MGARSAGEMVSGAGGNELKAIQAFEQDPGRINLIDKDLVLREKGDGTEVVLKIIKAVNKMPYNYVKHGKNMTSPEAVFTRDPA